MLNNTKNVLNSIVYLSPWRTSKFLEKPPAILSTFSSFGTYTRRGGWGAQRRAKKGGGGKVGHGLGRAEGEIRLVRVERGGGGGVQVPNENVEAWIFF